MPRVAAGLRIERIGPNAGGDGLAVMLFPNAKSWRAAKELWNLSRERAAAIAGMAAHDTYDKGRARLKKYKALRPAFELDPFAYWPPETPISSNWEMALRIEP